MYFGGRLETLSPSGHFAARPELVSDPLPNLGFVPTSVSVMSILSKAVVLKDGKPRSLACTSRDHVASLLDVMLRRASREWMEFLSRISPVCASMSNTLAGSAWVME